MDGRSESHLVPQWRDIAPYLDRALDLEPDERERWLAELTATQAELAANVRMWLARLKAADAQGFLNESPLLPNDLTVTTQPSLIGKRVGAYTIEHLLGRGGMGEVWLASRSDGRFEGRLAIKFIDSNIAHPKLAERFRHEGRLLGQLEHPNIARLIDAGTTEEGRQYLALEYVDGQRIDQYCDRHQLDVPACVRLFLDVISAVAHAHANLIIHRDLKPPNVFVTGDGSVKLLDFGIAKLVGGVASPEESSATRLEEAVLTPEYAAPEQLLGETPSTATDVYQLGMLLYVVLTGAHPVPIFQSRAERIKAALDGHIPRASDLAPPMVRKALRGDLDAILAMALRKDPAERYATAQALREDLVRFLDSEPVSARRGTTLYQTRKFITKHRFAVGAALLAIAGLCGISVVAVQQAHESNRQRDLAALEAKRAFAQLRFNTLMIASIGEPSKPISGEDILNNGVKLLETQYADDPDFVIGELIHISGRYMDWDNRQREYEVLTKAEAIARRTKNPLQLARVQCNMVETEIAFDRIDRASERLNEGRAALAAAQGVGAGDESDCLSASANLNAAQGRTQDAIADLSRAAALLERQHMTDNVRYAPLLDYLGEMYRSVGDFRHSYDYHHRSRLAKEQAGYGGTVGWNATLHNEAAALRDMGELRLALAQEAQVIKRDLTQSPNAPLPVAESLVYAGLLLRLNQPDEAMRWFDRAAADARAADNLVSTLNAQIGRARVFLWLQHLDKAAAELRAVENEADIHSQQFRHQYARARLVRTELLILQTKPDEALKIVIPMLAECRDPELGLGFYFHSALLLASRASVKDLTAAATFAQEAVGIAESRARDPEHSVDVGEAELLLAKARLLRNDLGEARTAAHRAKRVLTDALGQEHPLTNTAKAIVSEVENTRPVSL